MLVHEIQEDMQHLDVCKILVFDLEMQTLSPGSLVAEATRAFAHVLTTIVFLSI